MLEALEKITLEGQQQIEAAQTMAQMEAARVNLLGKKGSLTQLLRGLGDVAPEQRPAMGAKVNQVRAQLEAQYASREEALRAQEREAAMARESVDVTLPARGKRLGHQHPLSLVRRDVEDIFVGMGFRIAQGPEIEEDRYNFELLNVPREHPARDMQDTFYLTNEILLRTQTSPVQARVMLSEKPPIRVICPGRVFRADEADASHSPVFHQIEGLVVDRGITMSDLRGTLDVFARSLFGPSTRIRFRPSYFPFTEPSAEVDISCSICGAKGCKACKGSGWIEVLGCGMVHPNVLKNCGIDPQEYSGFAFGMGIERLTMLRYEIGDMRLLYENDLRFLAQF